MHWPITIKENCMKLSLNAFQYKKAFQNKIKIKYLSKVLSQDSDVIEAKVKVWEIYLRIYKKIWKFHLTALAARTLMNYILIFFSVSISAEILLSSLDVNKKLTDNFHLIFLTIKDGNKTRNF